MACSGDEVANLVLAAYNKLGRNGKPTTRSNGVSEWTILAGIVVAYDNGQAPQCVALATGVKASPEDKIRNSEGIVLHDCHAEILAIRAFSSYAIEHGLESIDKIYLYISAPPCGDASMSLLNGGESWQDEPQPVEGQLIRGRGHYNCLGHIRTKPGRTDSQLTMSKSCSDKLCLRQTRGLLLAPARQALHPQLVFLSAVVCPAVLPDFDRAFSRWNPQHRFAYTSTSLSFAQGHAEGAVPSTCSLVWTPDHFEVLNNGVKQGSKNKPSFVSRAMLAQAAAARYPMQFTGIDKYSDLKRGNTWPDGWQRTADDDFAIGAGRR